MEETKNRRPACTVPLPGKYPVQARINNRRFRAVIQFRAQNTINELRARDQTSRTASVPTSLRRCLNSPSVKEHIAVNRQNAGFMR